MAFTGKATYSAGATLPEIAEDVSDIIGIVSPHETPLLDWLGDPRTVARSTVHEWLEDSLLPNTDAINDTTFTPSATTATSFDVFNATNFQVGDQIRVEGSGEVMLVTAIDAPEITVIRGYGGTTPEALANGKKIYILGNAALEGAQRPQARFTNRQRKSNYCQIFTASVEVSGSQLAVNSLGVADELDYQKQERLRELLRDLENSVINGVAPTLNKQGSATVRRTMNGIVHSISTNLFRPGAGGIPEGGGADKSELTEPILNMALRRVWENSAGTVDTILVGGAQKRRINGFIGEQRGYAPGDARLSDLVNVYESDFGVCRVIVSRWVPSDSVLLLDSSRISVLPLAGRSFHFKRLASNGDSEVGQVIGEYTLQFMNENAHAIINGLAV
jgi:hypothetical protein